MHQVLLLATSFLLAAGGSVGMMGAVAQTVSSACLQQCMHCCPIRITQTSGLRHILYARVDLPLDRMLKIYSHL